MLRLAAGSLVDEGEGGIGAGGIASGGEEALRGLGGQGRHDHVCLPDFARLQVHLAIHSAADVARIDAEHAFLTQAHRLDLALADARVHEFRFHRLCPLHTQLLVVAGGTLLIRIALDQQTPVPILLEDVGLRREDRLGLVRQALPPDFKVEIRMDGVTGSGGDHLGERFAEGAGCALVLEQGRDLIVGELVMLAGR